MKVNESLDDIRSDKNRLDLIDKNEADFDKQVKAFSEV